MNLYALLHDPQSEYAFPTDVNRYTLRLRAAKDDLARAEVAVKYKYNEKPVNTVPMRKRFTDSLFDYYECEIDTDRGRRVYHFVLTDKSGNTVLFTENGAQAPSDVAEGYFPHFQVPFVSDSDVHTVPDKFRGAVIYQIFPDRFYTAKPKCDWGKRPDYRDFFGGELYGAAEKLDYLTSLGVNTVYLTPVNPSHTNHHYDVEDYYHVAADLGGDDGLRAFVDKAHSLGVKVIVDGVFNHCSAFNPFFRDVAEKGRASQYYDWFLIDGDKPDIKRCNYQTFAFNVAYMPKLDCDNRAVRDFVCDVTVHWIDNFGIDGWRLDVADDVAPALWREVRQAIKRRDGNAVIIGEDWMNPRPFLGGDMFDGVMNYGFTRAMRDWLAYKKTDAAGAAERLIRTLLRTSAPSAAMMMNLIGSHDTHRFFTLCGRDLLAHKAALSAMFFFEGMPTVYYGDELPLEGEHDPDCRRGMDWSRTGSDTAELIRRLAAIRTSDAFSVQSEISACGGALVMRRSGVHENTLLINMTDDDITTPHGAAEKRSVTIVSDGEHTVIK